MDNPFVDAKWGGEDCPNCKGGKCALCKCTGKVPYDLAGFMWKPEDDNEKHVIICIWNGELGEFTVDGFDSRLVQAYIDLDEHPEIMPLLPSPAEINAQSNPRAVAIASLERAGFKSTGRPNDWLLVFKRFNYDCCNFITMDMEGGIKVNIFEIAGTEYPDVSQQTLDAYRVLKPWVETVEWGAK